MVICYERCPANELYLPSLTFRSFSIVVFGIFVLPVFVVDIFHYLAIMCWRMKLNFIEERQLLNFFIQPCPQGYLPGLEAKERTRGGGRCSWWQIDFVKPFNKTNFFALQELTKKQNPWDVSSVWAIFFVFGFFFILKTSTVHKLTLQHYITFFSHNVGEYAHFKRWFIAVVHYIMEGDRSKFFIELFRKISINK